MDSVNLSDSTVLKYSIYKYSSYSSKFSPENILLDNPQDQSSRWSSDSHVPPQFLILKLEAPAVVTSITFGKFEKSHVCNVKKLHVYGGLGEEHMMLLLDGGLKNDSISETFIVKHAAAGTPFPVRYIKLMPLQTWGSTFNFSLWHVALSGCADPDLVRRCMHAHALRCEREALRVCLKHLRQQRYSSAYAALARESNVRLEHPLLTALHRACTLVDDTREAEQLLTRAAEGGLLNEYVQGRMLVPTWRRLLPPLNIPPSGTPGRRGGHQLCCDSQSQTIYLFGGWDGQQDLSDLWSYNIATYKWICISHDTRLQGGPSARSCHKVCLDPERRQLFTLGRYVDNKMRTPDNLKSDFYLYELETGRWTLITEDTAGVGGPKLVFDHQMVMDVQNREIYVFGGRVLTQSRWEGVGLDSERPSGSSRTSFSPAEPQLSGLYRYHVATNTWTCLKEDDTAPTKGGSVAAPIWLGLSEDDQATGSSSSGRVSGSAPQQNLKSRVGHSMLFHPVTRQLFILAGQRNREYLTDFLTYQVDTDTVTCVSEPGQCPKSGAGAEGALPGAFPHRPGEMPTAGFTQKATIDPLLEEIHVLSGLSKEKEKRDLACNSFWVYSIPLNKWSCIYHKEVSGDTPEEGSEPCPRFAHQLVYDHVNKVHYMFGGNPGCHDKPKLRLNDFWSLQLCRTTPEKLLREAIFAIRKNRYEELAVEDSALAMHYLQTDLHEAVDHTDSEQVSAFQRLACTLFQPADPVHCHPPPLSSLPVSPPLNLPLFSDILERGGGEDDGIFAVDDNPSSAGDDAMSQDSNDDTATAQRQFDAWKHHRRSILFNHLAKYFPEDMSQPEINLVDLVSL